MCVFERVCASVPLKAPAVSGGEDFLCLTGVSSLSERTGTGVSTNKPSESWEKAVGWSRCVYLPACVRACVHACVTGACKCVCTCVCVILYLLHSECQNTQYNSNVRTF